MLKSWGVVVGGGLQHFSVNPWPLGFGFGTKGFESKGLGPGLDNFLINELMRMRAHWQRSGRVGSKVCNFGEYDNVM